MLTNIYVFLCIKIGVSKWGNQNFSRHGQSQKTHGSQVSQSTAILRYSHSEQTWRNHAMYTVPVCTSINNIHFDSVPLSERASIIKTRTVMFYIQVLEPFQDFSSWLRRWWISFCRYWLGTCMVENVLEVFSANFNTFFADMNFNTFFVFLQQIFMKKDIFWVWFPASSPLCCVEGLKH